MNIDLKKTLTELKDVCAEISDGIVIDDPKDDFEEAYNDAVRIALASGYLAGATDAVLKDNKALTEHVIGFKILLNKIKRSGRYDK